MGNRLFELQFELGVEFGDGRCADCLVLAAADGDHSGDHYEASYLRRHFYLLISHGFHGLH